MFPFQNDILYKVLQFTNSKQVQIEIHQHPSPPCAPQHYHDGDIIVATLTKLWLLCQM